MFGEKTPKDQTEKAKEKSHETGEKIKQDASKTKDKTQEMAGETGEKLKEAGHETQHKAEEGADAVKSGAHKTGNWFTRKWNELFQSSSSK